MGKLLQWMLDAFHGIRRRTVCAVAFVSMRLYGLEVSANDVWNGTYSSRKHRNLELGGVADPTQLLDTAKECMRLENDRRTVVMDKFKTLLTVSSLLLALIGLFLPSTFEFETIWMSFLFLVAVGALLVTVTLLLVFLDVGTVVQVSLDQAEIGLSIDEYKKVLINTHMKRLVHSQNQTDYHVDLFKTARFFFLFAMTAVVLLFAVGYSKRSPDGQSKPVDLAPIVETTNADPLEDQETETNGTSESENSRETENTHTLENGGEEMTAIPPEPDPGTKPPPG